MKVHDRIRGALYGYALGDALGVGCEFMTRPEVQYHYPDGLRHFSQIIRDAHRIQWEQGDWTNDTELLVLFLEAIMENDGFDLLHIARRLKDWFDNVDSDVSPVYRAVLRAPEWAERPIKVAHEVWQNRRIREASNDATYRSIVAALTTKARDLDERVRQLVLMTNDDSRCVSTATVLARMAHSLLHTGEPATYDALAGICYSIDTRTIPYLDAAYKGSLEDLELDDEDTQAYTRKAMAAALWPIWHCDNAADSIYCIIEAGGDADSNAALAGALAGLRYGVDALPEEAKKMKQFDRLENLTRRLMDYMETKEIISK